MTIKIQYQDSVYDIVSADILQRLIDNGKIKMFYRYSEKRWIAIGADPVRRQARTSTPHTESERRASQAYKDLFLAPQEI